MRNLQNRWAKDASKLVFPLLVLSGAIGIVGCNSLPLDRNRDLSVQCRKDLQHAVQLRGLPLKREIAIERESQDKLVNALAAELDKPENQVFLTNTGVLLQQLRVIRKDQDLKSLFLKVMAAQVAAYYDPEKKRVAYVEGATKAFTNNAAAIPLMERFVYVHEFCHAVEDSQFDIERLSRDSLSDFDRNLALTSLIEGDAMLVGLDSVFAEAPANTATPLGALVVDVMGLMNLSDEMKTMGDCPAFLAGALIRPYIDGGIFSNRLRREAGWPAVDAVFQKNLPKTTAEILYPERRFLRGFSPAEFRPDQALFESSHSVLTNRLGAMGMALWLSGSNVVQRQQYGGFLKGWLGDELFFLKTPEGAVGQTVWLTYWERAGQAGAFCRNAERRLSESIKDDGSWCVRRNGRLAVIVWSDKKSLHEDVKRAELALKTEVDFGDAGGFGSWCNDLPWPVRFPSYSGYSSGFELLGGHAIDMTGGDNFCRFNLADGLILRAESTPDRCYWGTLCGLFRFVKDERSDFTFWRIPIAASWFRRGSDSCEKYTWRVLWGLAAYGNEHKASVLLIPVWRANE